MSYSSSTFDAGSVASDSDSPGSGIFSSFSSASESEARKSEPDGVHPFLYEPMTSSNSEDDNASDSSEDLSPRLLNLDGKSLGRVGVASPPLFGKQN